MAVFFCLTGFLIVTFLHAGMQVGEFLKKRLARIVSLVWLAMIVLVLWQGTSTEEIARNLLFVSNLPPGDLYASLVDVSRDAILPACSLARLVGGRRAMWRCRYRA
jgi:peptidoglycan/LPS O-acetylase OafA/YrhL